jgi:hypothetical protein
MEMSSEREGSQRKKHYKPAKSKYAAFSFFPFWMFYGHFVDDIMHLTRNGQCVLQPVLFHGIKRKPDRNSCPCNCI